MHDREALELWGSVGQADGRARARALAVRAGGLADPDAVPVGDVNRALLHAWLEEFGDRLECVAACPACGNRLEADVSASAILAEAPAGPPLREPWRQPTLADLDAVAASESLDAARTELARRCAGAGEDPDAVSAALEAADPHVAVRLSLHCPACDAPFAAVVDVAAHLWAAVDRRAQEVLADVAGLAGAFGWTEDEVLRLPAARRRAYLEHAAR